MLRKIEQQREAAGLPSLSKALEGIDESSSLASDAVHGALDLASGAFKTAGQVLDRLMPSLPGARAEESCTVDGKCDKVEPMQPVDEFCKVAQTMGFKAVLSESMQTRNDRSTKGVTFIIGEYHDDSQMRQRTDELIRRFADPGGWLWRGDMLLVEYPPEASDNTFKDHCRDFNWRPSTFRSPSCVGIDSRALIKPIYGATFECARLADEVVKAAGGVPLQPGDHYGRIGMGLTAMEAKPYLPQGKAFEHALTKLEAAEQESLAQRDALFARRIGEFRHADHATFFVTGAGHLDGLRQSTAFDHETVLLYPEKYKSGTV